MTQRLQSHSIYFSIHVFALIHSTVQGRKRPKRLFFFSGVATVTNFYCQSHFKQRTSSTHENSVHAAWHPQWQIQMILMMIHRGRILLCDSISSDLLLLSVGQSCWMYRRQRHSNIQHRFSPMFSSMGSN